MTTWYGFTGGDIFALPVTDPDAAGGKVWAPSAGTFEVYTTRLGNTQLTNLVTLAGAATTTVTADPLVNDGRALFGISDTGAPSGIANPYKGPAWLENTAARTRPRFLVNPVDLAERVAPDLAPYVTDVDLATALGFKAEATHTHAFSDLSDVDEADAGPGRFMTRDPLLGTYRFLEPPAPPSLFVTKAEGAATPGGTGPGQVVLVLAGAGTAWGYGTSIGGNGGTAVSSLPITVPAPIPVGTLVVVGIGADSAGSVQAVWSGTDTRGNTWTAGPSHMQGTSGQSGEIYSVLTTALQTGDIITPAANSVRAHMAVSASTVTGNALTAVLDKTAPGGAANQTSIVVGPTAALSQVDEIAFAAIAYNGSVASVVPTNGWATAGVARDSAATTTRRSVQLLYRIVSATTALTATAEFQQGGVGVTNNYSGVLGTFKKAA